jgi:hypothetical protein
MLLPLNPFDSSLGTAILQLRVCDPWLSKGPRKWAKLVQRVQLKQQFKEHTGGKVVMSVWDAHSMTVDDVAHLEADDPLDERKRYRTIASRVGRVERIVSFKPHHARRNLIHNNDRCALIRIDKAEDGAYYENHNHSYLQNPLLLVPILRLDNYLFAWLWYKALIQTHARTSKMCVTCCYIAYSPIQECACIQLRQDLMEI